MTHRLASRAELDRVLDWARAEGWNPGAADAAPFHATDPEGFFVAEQAGEVVAAISVVNLDRDFAFLGLYLCRPDWRGKGIGLALWHHSLTHAGARSIGLDGVAAQQANYARSGFYRTGATTRYSGQLKARTFGDIRPVTAADMGAIAALDHAATGFRRAGFLAGWLRPDRARHGVVLEGPAGIIGLAVARTCADGVKLGPILAPDADSAVRLASAALHGLSGGAARVDVDLPEDSRAFAAQLVQLGFAPGFTTARMWKGAPPVQTPLQQAIATMELG